MIIIYIMDCDQTRVLHAGLKQQMTTVLTAGAASELSVGRAAA
jgi:hypothetical protein